MNLIPQNGPVSASELDLLSSFPNIGPAIDGISEEPINISGGFGDLYIGTHDTFGKVALKRPRFPVEDRDRVVTKLLLAEADTWRGLRHARVLEFVGVAQIDGFIYLVSPYIANGTLATFIKKVPEADQPRLLGETAEAILFLHQRQIIHGDIKANNILVSNDLHALLFDFGAASTESSAIATGGKSPGSLRWQSPEVWLGSPRSFKSDIYSFGMTIFEVLTGKIPFEDRRNDYAVIKAAFSKNERPPLPTFSPTKAKSHTFVWKIAEVCAEVEPEVRPDMEIINRLFEILLRTKRTSPPEFYLALRIVLRERRKGACPSRKFMYRKLGEYLFRPHLSRHPKSNRKALSENLGPTGSPRDNIEDTQDEPTMASS